MLKQLQHNEAMAFFLLATAVGSEADTQGCGFLVPSPPPPPNLTLTAGPVCFLTESLVPGLV